MTPRDIARSGAVFLDFDGTLVEIAPRPDSIVVPGGLPGMLDALCHVTGGACAVISGRSISTLDGFLAPARLAIAGEHGAALRRSGDAAVERIDAPDVPVEWITAAEAMVARHPGALIERKPAGLTLHARACPDALPGFAAVLAAMAAEDARFVLLHAHMAVELRPAGADKGRALAALMAQPPFAGRVPVFVGDDVTDEDAIAAAEALGGVGYRVADAFGDPAGVRAWLGDIVAAGAVGGDVA